MLKIWKKSLFCVHKKENHKSVYFNLWEKWEQKTKCCIYMFEYLVQYLQFVSGALKWPQNLAGLKLVFNKLGLLWRHHWLCVLYWAFTANFTPPHTQYGISCRHIPCWWPASHHQHTSSKTQHKLVLLVSSYAGLCLVFPQGTGKMLRCFECISEEIRPAGSSKWKVFKVITKLFEASLNICAKCLGQAFK